MADKDQPIKPAEVKITRQTSETKETTSPHSPAEDSLVETKHTLKIGGQEIKYTAVAGTIVMKEEPSPRDKEFEGEKPRAQVFFIAYLKDGVEDRSTRPITFSFNGGPGSSSIWLHMGLLGPRREIYKLATRKG